MQDNKQPLVSVVVPTYLPGAHLLHTIDSIMEQTYPCIEIVLVIDGDMNNITQQILCEYSHCRIIRQGRSGVSVARNRGLLESIGEYISFVDHDDILLPTKIETQVRTLQNNTDCRLTYCDIEIIRDPTKVEAKSTLEACTFEIFPPELDMLSSVIRYRETFIVPSAIMYHRSIFAQTGMFEPNLPFSGDYLLFIAAVTITPVIHVKETLVGYLVHDHNYSRNYLRSILETQLMSHMISLKAQGSGNLVSPRRVYSLLRRPRTLYAYQAIDAARDELSNGNLVLLFKHIWFAIMQNPYIAAKALLSYLQNRVQNRNR